MPRTELIPKSIKQKVRGMVRPIAEAFLKTGMTPNTMTVVGVVFSLVAAIFFALKILLWGGIFYLLAGVCDILDGAMARRSGQDSSYGAFLDSTLDRFAEAIALMGVMVYFHRMDITPMIYITYLAVAGSLLVSYSKARSEGLGQECNVGWLERPERVTLVVAGTILGAIVGAIWDVNGAHWGLTIAIGVVLVFSFVTVGQRMHYSYRGFKAKGKA